ncbi:AIFM3 [Cordylochernes scorpioides]|uniref:AIFM3 n=1 Tax=Cordylochernes scorpioides TaxID=51811 RepID=A0ABY6LAA8_9ARAC|nr:AIFM3 [Cordylochernes scorpioides]
MGNCRSKSGETPCVHVCKESELEDGKMKVFDVDNIGQVLVVKDGENISVLGSKCTHYGAPLVNGIYSNGQIRCPWHGACFNSKTGDIEEYPGLDCLPTYTVLRSDDNICIESPKEGIVQKRERPLSKKTTDSKTIVLIGSGAAAETCLETLRQEGFDGKIIMISKDQHLPYDRPKLSKSMESKISAIQLRPDEYYDKAEVDLQLEKTVTSVDPASKSVELSNGTSIKYDTLLVATGGEPRTMDVKNSNLTNIFYLRTLKDANTIARVSQGKKVVVVGTSFIAMEVAASLVGGASMVQVVGRSSVPFANVFGSRIGEKVKEMFIKKGVTFYLETNIIQFAGDKTGNLIGVSLDCGVSIPADICVVGIGIVPATAFLKNSVKRTPNGFVVVNGNLQTSDKNIYAAGDIANFPLKLAGKSVSIGHWQLASKHGHVAAMNMLGKKEEVSTVPFFWSMLFGKGFRYAGYCDTVEDIVYDMAEDVDNFSYIAYYIQGGVVAAVSTLGRDPLAAKFAALLQAGKVYRREDIEENPLKDLDISSFQEEQRTSL